MHYLHGLCTFPNMVSNVNIMRISGIIAKIMRKWAKSWDTKERYDVYLLIMLKYSVRGLCAFPNMVINVNIMRKSGKNEEKKQRHHVYLLLRLRYSLHGLCAFPNMVINVNIMRKSGKNRKNEDTDVDHCQQC